MSSAELGHAEDCSECDGSGFFTVYFESEGLTEYNCGCREAATMFELCDECEAVNH